jgi:hypothetical protein
MQKCNCDNLIGKYKKMERSICPANINQFGLVFRLNEKKLFYKWGPLTQPHEIRTE